MSRKHHDFFIGGEAAVISGGSGGPGGHGHLSGAVSRAERDEKVALQDTGGNHTKRNRVRM